MNFSATNTQKPLYSGGRLCHLADRRFNLPAAIGRPARATSGTPHGHPQEWASKIDTQDGTEPHGGGWPIDRPFKPEETRTRVPSPITTKPAHHRTSGAASFFLHDGLPVHRIGRPFAGASRRTDATREHGRKIDDRISKTDADNIITIANALRSGRRPLPTRAEAVRLALAVVVADAARFVPR
jgi:hypothetical protein